jgi:hypothetical protein
LNLANVYFQKGWGLMRNQMVLRPLMVALNGQTPKSPTGY